MRSVLRAPRRWPLIIEAFVGLALASLLIAIFPFRRIAEVAASRARSRRTAPPEVAHEIGGAVAAWAHRVPWRAVCFQQGLAAQILLRRRGLAGQLYYGARRTEEGRLVAHVWVRSGDVDVIGCVGTEAYGLLAVFPAVD